MAPGSKEQKWAYSLVMDQLSDLFIGAGALVITIRLAAWAFLSSLADVLTIAAICSSVISSLETLLLLFDVWSGQSMSEGVDK